MRTRSFCIAEAETPTQTRTQTRKEEDFGRVRLSDDLGIDSVDFVDIPGRGRCRVYLARYSYDPFKQSPNENPELELSLSAGEYVLIFGEIDDDGFYNGELLDGQRGLVPSNFIDKLTGTHRRPTTQTEPN